MLFPSKWVNIGIVILSTLLSAWLLVFQSRQEAFLLLLLPIVATAVLHGFTGGMAAGMMGTAVLLLFASISQTPWPKLQPLAALYLLIGLVAGWLLAPPVQKWLAAFQLENKKQASVVQSATSTHSVSRNPFSSSRK